MEYITGGQHAIDSSYVTDSILANSGHLHDMQQRGTNYILF